MATRFAGTVLRAADKHATARFYERLGFEPTNEMRLDIDSALMPDNDVPAP